MSSTRGGNERRELFGRAVKLGAVILIVLGAFAGGLILAASASSDSLFLVGILIAVFAPVVPFMVAGLRLASQPVPRKPESARVGFLSRAHAPPRPWESFAFLGAGALSGAWAIYLLVVKGSSYGGLWLLIALLSLLAGIGRRSSR